MQVPGLAIDGVGIGRIHQSACEEGLARQVEHVPVPPLAYIQDDDDFYDNGMRKLGLRLRDGKNETLVASSTYPAL